MQFNNRPLKTKLHKDRKRSESSTRWLQRQMNDPYVAEAHRLGFRGRAAFKIQQLNDQFHFFKSGKRVVDLGCAPGGWTQVAVKAVHSTQENPLVVGMDLLPTQPIAGAKLVQMDFTDEQAPAILQDLLGGHKADIVMSDMAANTTGNHMTDHTFLAQMKRNFKVVKHVKPDASRKDSSEFYVVATGFKGNL